MASISIGVTVDDRFVIERVAGTGGMGRVFYAFDTVAERPVAVKVMADARQTDAARFRREAEFLAQIEHPRLARYVAHGTWDEAPYLVQEWIEGITLGQYLTTTGCTIREAIVVVREVAAALGALHDRQIVHRDVKPSNIILEDGDIERPRLVDLGVARRIGDAVAHSLTRTGAFVGTPGYTSPEQVLGAKSIGPPSDLFALGAILYECVTGMPAFAGVNGLARNTKVQLLDPPGVLSYCPDAPASVVATIDRLLQKAPGGRLQSVTELIAALPDPAELPHDGRRRKGWFDGTQTARPVSLGMRTPPRMSVKVNAGDELACVILAVPTGQWTEDGDGSSEALLRTASAYGVRASLHEDGSVTALLSGVDAAGTAAAAARCALALATDRSMTVLVSSAVRDSDNRVAADVLEWAFTVLETWALRLALQPQNDGLAVRIDETTAGLLADRFQVVRNADMIHLVGEAAA
jgi:eukaryotic-like serine/threonine-protein kinase